MFPATRDISTPASRLMRMQALILAGALLFPITAQQADGAAKDTPIFVDVSEKWGLDFIHFNGMTGEFYFPEMTGQGGAFLDYDNDGDLDVFLVQGSLIGPDDTMDKVLFPPSNPELGDRLFRNDLTVGKDGERDIRFVDVTAESGLKGADYGMGAATGDFNNDGRIDLYVTNYGPNRMWYNNGDGTFTDVTDSTGTADGKWGTSAAVLDYDRDGWLDLYVANYVDFDAAANKKCYARSSRRDYCGPSGFPPQRDRLFHNRGDGTFEDVTGTMLVGYEAGPGLGVVATDANSDGWLDLFVANDGAPNQLWLNRKGLAFKEDGLFSGVSVNLDGQAEGSMGVAMGDFDSDGDEDIFLTHIMQETNTLYVNDGSGLFEDRTLATGLASPSFSYTAFGTGWIDYDNNGLLDLLVLNGAVLTIEKLDRKGDPYPLHQPNQLFRNDGGRRFIDITSQAGPALAISEVSRGAAFGDVDNDGDMDAMVINNNGPVRMLQNSVGDRKKWLGLRLVDGESGRDLLGALAALKRTNMPTLWRRVRTDGSYCSAGDPRILFGLGEIDTVESVEIFWPDGTVEQWRAPVTMRYTTLTKGAVNLEGSR